MKLETVVPHWSHQAACQDHPVLWWFTQSEELTKRAIAVCQTCPVTLRCEQEADLRGETEGVWNGKPRHKVKTA